MVGANRTDKELKFTPEPQGERSSKECTDDESVVFAGT